MKGKKGLFTWTRFMIGLIVFSLFVVVLGGAYYSFTFEYGVDIDNKYGESSVYNKLGAISNETTGIADKLKEGEASTTSGTVLAVQSTYAAGQIMLATVSLPIEMLNQFTADVPIIPKIFVIALITILSIMFIFAVGSLFARWFF